MKLTSIQMSDFQNSGRITQPLSGVDVVTGRSMTGKTIRLNAVKVGLAGHLPRLGVTKNKQFITGPDCAVVLNFDTGKMVSRVWTTGRGGKVQYTGDEGAVIPPVLLDVQTNYLNLSGPARVQYVLDRVPVTDFKVDAFTAALKCLPVDEPNEHTQAAMNAAAVIADGLEKDREQEDASVQQFLMACGDSFKKAADQAQGVVDRMIGMVQGHTQLAPGLNQQPPRNVREQLDEARADYSKASADYTGIVGALDVWRRHTERLQRTRERLGSLARPANSAESIDEGTIAALEAQAAGIEMPNVEGALQALNAKQIEKMRVTTERTQLVKRMNEALTKFDADCKHEKCPFCKSNRKGWREEIEKEFHEAAAASQKQLDQMTASLKKINDAIEILEKELAAMRERRKAAENALADFNRQLRDLRGKLRELTALAEARSNIEAEIRGIESNEVPAVEQPQIDRALATFTKAEQKMRDLQAEQNRFVEHQQAAIAQAKATTALEEATATAKVYKLAVKYVKDVQKEISTKAIEKLLDVARLFTDNILPAPLQFLDGQIGFIRNGHFVSDLMSGTEAALVHAGLSVALAQEAQFKIVVIDEMGITDTQTKEQILSRMIALQARGVIDNFIGADSNVTARVAGVNYINVG